VDHKTGKLMAALRQGDSQPGPGGWRRRGGQRCFNLVELVLIVTILVGVTIMVLPLIYEAMKKGRISTCKSNLQTLGEWVMMYADGNDGLLPAYEDGWVRAVAAKGGTDVDQGQPPKGKFACPDQRLESYGSGVEPVAWWRGSHYGINQHLASRLVSDRGEALPYWNQARIKQVKSPPAEKLLLADAVGGNYFGIPDRDPVVAGLSRNGLTAAESLPPKPVSPFPYLRHLKGTGNFLFLDGHVGLETSWPELGLGRGTHGYEFWHAEHLYPGLPETAPPPTPTTPGTPAGPTPTPDTPGTTPALP
jgi:prepilin-type processing-associated H-X9-DG protein